MTVWSPRGIMSATSGSENADYIEFGVVATRVEDVSVITIRGPLETHANCWGFASYDEVFAAFVESRDAKAIVLDIDSPGGMTMGNIECARACRGLALPPVYAVANYSAASAAYALACIADQIFAADSAMVGSIGTRAGVMSYARMNEQAGLDIRLTSSGSLKLDGDPDMPLDDAAVSRNQLLVDELAAMFFAWVSERRGGLDAKALEGACFLGGKAKELGLVDGVATLGQVLGAVITDK